MASPPSLFPPSPPGPYRFPPDRAARIALGTVLAALQDAPSLERVVFCCFGVESRRHHAAAFTALTSA
jgi:O-acetyl-ADP-ribose deacetylase